MQLIKCTLLYLRPNVGSGVPHAMVVRHSDHPRLGPPNGKATVTSYVKVIDFERKFFVTQNNIYDFSGDQ